jgi:hypothetical protein
MNKKINTESHKGFNLKGFIDEYAYGLILVIFIVISTFLFEYFTRLELILSLWFGFITAGFVTVVILILNENILKRNKINTKAKLANINSEQQHDMDIQVIMSLGKCLENLPEDRLPKESDLEYPISRIEEAILRLKSSGSTPANFRLALVVGERYLALFKEGSLPQ